MLQKKFWIPILIVLLAVVGCGLFYSKRIAQQERVNVHKPIEVEQPPTSKPPPPGETAESGHWHGDEWHAEPHGAHPPAEVSEQPQPTTEGQGAPVGAQHVGAQPPAPMQDSSRTRTPQEEAETQKRWRAWSEWEDKAHELRVNFSQVSKANTDLMPKTAEEAERYQTDKEWQRKMQEATDKYDEALRMLQEHEAKRVLPPAQ